MADWVQRLMAGESSGLTANLLRLSLWGCSGIYGFIVLARNAAYEWRLLPSHTVSVPVISIGNVTTGGTGKTPVVAYVANFLVGAGHRPVILSRGYRSLPPRANGPGSNAIDTLPQHGNDEFRLLQNLCPAVPHRQSRDRVAIAKQAIESDGASCLILDDGFQHRRLARTLNIVLIDAVTPFGYGHLLPRGLLRESLSSLKRADFVCITRAGSVSSSALSRIRETVEREVNPVSIAALSFETKGLRNALGERLPLEALSPTRIAAFAGIGNSTAWRLTVEKSFPSVVGQQSFPDHHHYTAFDLQQLEAWGNSLGAGALVTTAKDLVKIPKTALGPLPLWAVDISPVFLFGEEAFRSRLLAAVGDFGGTP